MPLTVLNDAEKLGPLFSALPAALAVLRGPQFVFELANEAYLDLVGRPDIVGKSLNEALPEIKDQGFPEILRKVYETGETYQARDVKVFLRLTPGKPQELTRRYVDLTYKRMRGTPEQDHAIFVFAVDVTEKVEARARVLLERQKLGAVFANASASLAILVGPQSVYEDANQSYLELFNGRTIIGKPLLEALPELKGQKFPDLITEVFRTGEAYREIEAVAYLRRTDQGPLEKRYFDQSYIRIETGHRDPYGVLIQAIDVTERVLARNALAESETRFRVAIDAAKMGTWSLDPATGLVEWSARTRELFGGPEKGEITLEMATRYIHPDDLDRVQIAIGRAIDPRGDGFYQIEYRIRLPSGRVHWVSLRGQAFFADTPEGRRTTDFSGTVLDVTERMQAEQALRGSERQFRMMADVMPQIVWTARPDGLLDYTNRRWFLYSGSDDPEQWLTFLHPADVEKSVEVWTHSVMTGEPYNLEFRLRRASDQTYRWFLARANPAFDSEGKVERWFGTCTDIQDQKDALATRNEFMQIASHELKTPLTSLKLQTQSMRRNYQKGRPEAFSLEKVGALIATNEKQVDRLVRLVDDMLDLSKIESGKLTMNREPTELGELVREVYAHLREQLEAAGSSSSLETQGAAVASVDRFRIEQVVTNLLTNAIRYGNAKPVSIRVRAEGDRAILSVADQGLGVAPEHQGRIFRRFERGVSANDISGLGLGLYISREIVESHQGRIWVESELGQGSTFYVELPLAKV